MGATNREKAPERSAPGLRYGTEAEVAVWVKSKRITAEPGMDEPAAEEEAGCANCHWRAAFSARSAKNWLEAGLASSAVETVPSGLSCTRTLMRTVPRMVARDFSETSGRTLRSTARAGGSAADEWG